MAGMIGVGAGITSPAVYGRAAAYVANVPPTFAGLTNTLAYDASDPNGDGTTPTDNSDSFPKDISGNARHGVAGQTSVGSVLGQAPKWQAVSALGTPAWRFNGSAWSVVSTTGLAGLSNYTIGLLLRYTDNSGDEYVVGGANTIMGWEAPGSTKMRLVSPSDGGYLAAGKTTTQMLDLTAALVVVVTSGVALVYINGVSQGTMSLGSDADWRWLGSWSNSSRGFRGDLRRVAFYSGAASGAQRATLEAWLV